MEIHYVEVVNKDKKCVWAYSNRRILMDNLDDYYGTRRLEIRDIGVEEARTTQLWDGFEEYFLLRKKLYEGVFNLGDYKEELEKFINDDSL